MKHVGILNASGEIGEQAADGHDSTSVEAAETQMQSDCTGHGSRR
jgi:hypothetical protein